jgi:hypothetical protein
VLCCTAFPSVSALRFPAPLPVAQLCSSVSQLLWQSLTSHVRASSALAPRLPDADQIASLPLAGRGTSRFPCNELPHMPGSSTTPGPPGARACALVCIAFRLRNGVSTRDLRSMWIATPSSYRTCTDYSLPVSRRTATDSVRHPAQPLPDKENSCSQPQPGWPIQIPRSPSSRGKRRRRTDRSSDCWELVVADTTPALDPDRPSCVHRSLRAFHGMHEVGGQGAQGPDGSVLRARVEGNSASVLRRGRESWRISIAIPPNALGLRQCCRSVQRALTAAKDRRRAARRSN